MKNFSLYVLVDNLFKYCLIFMLNIIWTTYLINNFIASFFISLILSLFVLTAINLMGKQKLNKNKNFLKEQQKIIDIKNTFLIMTNFELINFFYTLASKKHKCLKFTKYIKVISSGKPTILIPHFKQSEFEEDDFINTYKEFKNQQIKRLIILTNKKASSLNINNIQLNFEVLILDHTEVYYHLLKNYEFYPETVKTKPKIKNNFKQLLSYAFNKKRTKSYLFCSLFLLFSSLFTIYKLYYLIFSTILISFALFSYFNPTFNKVNKTQIFD